MRMPGQIISAVLSIDPTISRNAPNFGQFMSINFQKCSIIKKTLMNNSRFQLELCAAKRNQFDNTVIINRQHEE